MSSTSNLLVFAVLLRSVLSYTGVCEWYGGYHTPITLDCSAASSAQELGDIPASGPSGLIHTVILQGSSISYLPVNAFGDARARQYYINNNNLTRVDFGALGVTNLDQCFSNTNCLSHLDFSNNFISYFPFHYLRLLTSLLRLFLSKNQLKTIPIEAYFPPTLEYLDLTRNHISTVAPHAFAGATNLKYVFLSENKITTLTQNMFFTTSIVQPRLYLENNLISDMETNVFGESSGGREYRVAVMSNNSLTSLPEQSLSRFLLQSSGEMTNVVVVDGNPIQCDCNLAWLYRKWIIYGNKVTSKVHGLFCSHSGVFLWDLKPEHFSSCPSA